MNASIQYLFSLQRFGMKFGLRNIRVLLRSVGNPHQRYKTIHVAGTNGKGSTASMIASILTSAGYTVGLYTSPHLVSFNERIRINGRMISDSDVAGYTELLRLTLEKSNATFFEAATAIAFRYFADKKVDVAVIETGLGGRLDSTNVIRPIVSVITSIGLDHTEQLGPSIASIASEKAGIIKSRIPVIVGKIPPQAKKVIFRVAKKMRSPVMVAGKIPLPDNIRIELAGKYQTINARCAMAAVTVAGKYFLVGDRAVRNGLENTSSLSGLRARFEIIDSRPNILLDVAHNPDGLKHLVNELTAIRKKKIVLFGVMKDKDYPAMLRNLKKLNCAIVVTNPKGSRALPADALYRSARQIGLKCTYSSNADEALRRARKIAGKTGFIVVTGSHYVVGEVMALLNRKK